MINSQTIIQNPRNISDILDSDNSSLGIRSADIEAIIWSHAHFDHIGDPSTFPLSTDLIVGPGIRDTHWPGYPTEPNAINLNSDIQGRRVREISFEKTETGAVTIGSFEALDFFGDGSFYLLNGPGHSIGHICALARVTASPDTFVFMGGDSCHHPGVLRPTKYQPCPIDSLHSSSVLDSESVFTLSPAITHDYDAALKTVQNIQELDASDDVFVILAHDNTLKGNVDFYPSTINDWKAKGYDKKTRWLFFKELENLEENSK
jgi:glyoxylase-like metal-dependent hydrolase (beta-lactamase superfamily II)